MQNKSKKIELCPHYSLSSYLLHTGRLFHFYQRGIYRSKAKSKLLMLDTFNHHGLSFSGLFKNNAQHTINKNVFSLIHDVSTSNTLLSAELRPTPAKDCGLY